MLDSCACKRWVTHHKQYNDEAIVLWIALFKDDTFHSAKTAKPGGKPDFFFASLSRKRPTFEAPIADQSSSRHTRSEKNTMVSVIVPANVPEELIKHSYRSWKWVTQARLHVIKAPWCSKWICFRACCRSRVRRKRWDAKGKVLRRKPQDADVLCSAASAALTMTWDSCLQTASWFLFLFMCLFLGDACTCDENSSQRLHLRGWTSEVKSN